MKEKKLYTKQNLNLPEKKCQKTVKIFKDCQRKNVKQECEKFFESFIIGPIFRSSNVAKYFHSNKRSAVKFKGKN